MRAEMDEYAHTELIRDLFSWEDSLFILAQLHEERLTAADESLTVSIKDLIDLVADVDPSKDDDPGKEQLRQMDSSYRKEILPAMHRIGMVRFSDGHRNVTATPRTTEYYLVVQPHRFQQRRFEEIVSAVSWLAWRYDCLSDPVVDERSES